ncbi:SDR family NAD(P)-dependent oxidoreductase [Candidatus Avelusimicrobium luingense]|uniref:SDR family NAD(P)-dependent oxidoreductase n=1 Tax=Candidatus Avelusimicrobium luingense TaxID=3416211 RepID=UPI003D1226D9
MKTLFLLGGGGAIGSAIKALFIQQGYTVLAPRSRELDLSDSQAIVSYMEKFTSPVDALIFCAGHNDPAPIGQLTNQEIQKTYQINTASFATLVAHLRKQFEQQKKGYILGISSLYGSISREGRAAYAMSKHAMNGLIQTLALELGPHGILCNTLSPGFVMTPMTQKNNTAQMIETLARQIPLGHLAAPEDIARVAYFLCSEQNQYITGQDIVVDGGFMAGGFQHV